MSRAIDGPLFSAEKKSPCFSPSKNTLIIKLRLSAIDSTSKFLIVNMLRDLVILVKHRDKEGAENRAMKTDFFE